MDTMSLNTSPQERPAWLAPNLPTQINFAPLPQQMSKPLRAWERKAVHATSNKMHGRMVWKRPAMDTVTSESIKENIAPEDAAAEKTEHIVKRQRVRQEVNPLNNRARNDCVEQRSESPHDTPRRKVARRKSLRSEVLSRAAGSTKTQTTEAKESRPILEKRRRTKSLGLNFNKDLEQGSPSLPSQPSQIVEAIASPAKFRVAAPPKVQTVVPADKLVESQEEISEAQEEPIVVKPARKVKKTRSKSINPGLEARIPEDSLLHLDGSASTANAIASPTKSRSQKRKLDVKPVHEADKPTEAADASQPEPAPKRRQKRAKSLAGAQEPESDQKIETPSPTVQALVSPVKRHLKPRRSCLKNALIKTETTIVSTETSVRFEEVGDAQGEEKSDSESPAQLLPSQTSPNHSAVVLSPAGIPLPPSPLKPMSPPVSDGEDEDMDEPAITSPGSRQINFATSQSPMKGGDNHFTNMMPGQGFLPSPNDSADEEELGASVETGSPVKRMAERGQRRMTPRLSDDTSMLKDFLSRNKLRAAAKTEDKPSTEIVSPKKNETTEVGTSTPPKRDGKKSKVTVSTPPGKARFVLLQNETEGSASPDPIQNVRRSARSKANFENKLIEAGNAAKVPEVVEPLPLAQMDDKGLTVMTRANTRKNKGRAKMPVEVLEQLAAQNQTTVAEAEELISTARANGKQVMWDQRLVYFQDTATGAPPEIARSPEKIIRVRRLKDLGAAPGTPAPKKMISRIALPTPVVEAQAVRSEPPAEPEAPIPALPKTRIPKPVASAAPGTRRKAPPVVQTPIPIRRSKRVLS